MYQIYSAAIFLNHFVIATRSAAVVKLILMQVTTLARDRPHGAHLSVPWGFLNRTK